MLASFLHGVDANKKLHAKEVELVETQQLNTEYQVKLHSDDMQFINYRSEINFWERKCESQSKELTKLNDAITALRSSNQALEEKLSKAKTDHLDCDNYKANISDEKVCSVPLPVWLPIYLSTYHHPACCKVTEYLTSP